MSTERSYDISGNADHIDWRLFSVSLIEIFLCGYITVSTVVLQFVIRASLHLNYLEMIWVSLSYTAVATGLVAFAGQVNRVFKHVFSFFIIAALLMLCGTILLSVSYNKSSIYTARIIQAVAAAIMTPATLTITQIACPKVVREKASFYWALAVSCGTLFGSFIGALCALATWHLAYWLALPFLCLSVYLIWPYRRLKITPRSWREIDYVGMLLFFCSAVILVLLFSTGFQFGWTSPVLISFYALGPILFLLFLWYERYPKKPLLLYRVTKNRYFLGGMAVVFLNYWILFSYLFVYTLYAQSIVGPHFGLFEACVTLLPYLVPFVVAASIGGWLGRRFDRLSILIVSSFVLCISFLSMFFIYPFAGFIAIWWAQALSGFAMGLIIVLTNSFSISVVAPSDAPFASSFYATCMYMGASIGVAISQMVYGFIYPSLLTNRLSLIGLPSSQINQIIAMVYSDRIASHVVDHSLRVMMQRAGILRSTLAHAMGTSFSYVCLLFAALAMIMLLILLFLKRYGGRVNLPHSQS